MTPKTKKSNLRKEFIESYNLPSAYNVTQITLIARDPFWMYAYWDISSKAIATLKKELGHDFDHSVYVLRMHDVTAVDFDGDNANHWFDIEVTSETKDWYVNLWRDHVSYCGEIGLRTPDGRYYPLARSNYVTTPRSSSSPRSDMIWMNVKGEHQQAFIYAEQRTQQIKKTLQLDKDTTTEIKKSRKRIMLTPDDIKAYYANLFPLLKHIKSRRPLKVRYPKQEKKQLDDEILDQKPWLSHGLKGDAILDQSIIPGFSNKHLSGKHFIGSSAESIPVFGASEIFPLGASEKNSPINSYDIQKRKFFFGLWTELIVYGRTEPTAEVWHGSQRIHLREDGTFSLRIALPDGSIPLNFTAISKDKIDQRKISTEVERKKTRYVP